MEETIRSHNDLLKGNAPFYTKAVKHYEALAKRASDNGHVIDLFMCALDQIGTAEMKSMVDKTGGLIVLHDTFNHEVFRESFRKIFLQDEFGQMLMCFNGQIEVITSRYIYFFVFCLFLVK